MRDVSLGWRLAGLLALVLALSGCGGNGGAALPPTISVSPGQALVAVATTQQFTATVANAEDKTATWAVNGVDGGNDTVGRIDANGLYTAPATIPNPNTVTVTATANADKSKKANAVAAIFNPTTPISGLAPPRAVAGSASFSLVVLGTNFLSGSTIRWSGNRLACPGDTPGPPPTLDDASCFISSGQLRAVVSADLIQSPTTAQVTVRTPGGVDSPAVAFSVVAGIPVVSHIEPASVTAGAADFDLIVRGGYFHPGTKVDFNGTAKPSVDVTVNSGNQITVKMKTADVANPGEYPLVLINGGGGSSFANLVVMPSSPPASIGTTNLAPATGPRGVAIWPTGNVALVANHGSDNVSVVDLATGNITTTIPLAPGTAPRAIAVNPDMDQALVANSNNRVSVLDLPNSALLRTLDIAAPPGSATLPAPAVAINPITKIALVTQPGIGQLAQIDLTNTKPPQFFTVSSGLVGVAVDVNLNWAVLTNPGGNTVSILDLNPATPVELPPLAVGTQPIGVAVDSTLHLAVVANRGSGTVSIVDLTRLAVTATLAVGSEPLGVDINPHTHVAAVTNSLTGTLTLVDLNSQTVLGNPLAVAAQPGAVALHPATNVAVAADAVAGTVTRVDVGDTATFKNFTLSFISPHSTAPSGGSGGSLDIRANGTGYQSSNNVAYGDLPLSSTLANAGRLVGTLPFTAFSAVSAETVTVVDTGTNRRTNAVGFRVEKSVAVGRGPTGIAVNPHSQLGIVVNGLESNASVLDLVTGTVRSTISLQASSSPAGVAINPFNNVAVITLRARNQAAVVDLITASQISTINVGGDPVGVALNPITNVAVVTNAGTNTVSVIQLGTGQVATIGDGIQVAPSAVAINTVTNQAVVVNNGSSSVSIIDLAASPPAVIGTPIPLAPASDPRAVAIDETTNTAYVAQFATNNIAQIDLATRTLTGILPGGKDPIALAFNPNTKELFISQAGLNRVAVLDLTQAPPSFVDFVLTGAGPQGVAVDLFTDLVVVANHDANSVTFSRPLH